MNVTTLVCIYLACWEITSTRGVEDVVMMCVTPTLFGDFDTVRKWTQPSSPVPFVVGSGLVTREYYFWFFGYVIELRFHGRGPWANEVGVLRRHRSHSEVRIIRLSHGPLIAHHPPALMPNLPHQSRLLGSSHVVSGRDMSFVSMYRRSRPVAGGGRRCGLTRRFHAGPCGVR